MGVCSLVDALCLFALVVSAYILYKILDRLIRIPRVGNYTDRYILVTGCDTGFGNAIAKRLDALECHVFAGCYTEKGETELTKVCSERLLAISLDVTRKESVRNALACVKTKLPHGRGLWGILNNAGNLLTAGRPDWLTIEDFKDQCDVNLWGLIDVTLTFLPLVKKEKGRVVNTASLAGRISLATVLPYTLSKYGVEAFTDGIRRTIHYFGGKACLIEPGGFRTQIGIHLLENATKLWQRTSPEVKADYGEDYFKRMMETEFDENRYNAPSSLSPVIDAYEHALLGRYPRARYVVGNDAKFMVALQTLPEWLGDWIIRWLERDHPLPASMRR